MLLPDFRRTARAAALAVLLALPAACTPVAAPAPTPTQAPSPQPTAMPTLAPTPTQAPSPQPTAVPTTAPAPTSPPAPSATLAPTATPAPGTPDLQIYQKADGSLWRISASDRAPVQLIGPTDIHANTPGSIAPDGRGIAFVAGTGVWGYESVAGVSLALYLADATAPDARRLQDLLPPRALDLEPGAGGDFDLLQALAHENRPAWSPDSTRFAFISAHEGQPDLYVGTAAGALTRLTNSPAYEFSPRWNPDGASVAVLSVSSFGTGAGWSDTTLTVVPAGGGEPIYTLGQPTLENGDTVSAIEDLTWVAPDMLVARLESPPVGGAEVRAISIPGGEGTVIAAIDQGGFNAVAWSEPIQTLAISGDQTGLVVWRPGDSRATPITQDPVRVLAWSPQGNVLAYCVTAEGRAPGVLAWAIGADGDIRRVTSEPAGSVVWSPDGRMLAIDSRIYVLGGGELASLPGAVAGPLEWGPGGLFFTSRQERTSETSEIWLWDGLQATKLDQGVK